MSSGVLTIGDLSKATGTKVETIRYYERIGLLAAPGRTGGNYRAYAVKDLGRLSFIRRARDLGFALEQVRELLSLSDQKKRSCEAVDAIARDHLTEVDKKLADLKALRRELDSIISQCGCGTIAECRIIEALAPPCTATMPSHALAKREPRRSK
jgi:DNA-binding transcriptional MerR regulator